MGTRMLTVALGTKLVALIACPGYSPAYGMCTRSCYCPCTRAVGLVSMLAWRAVSWQVVERIVGARGKAVEGSTMHVAWGDMARRQHGRRRGGAVLGEAVQRIGQHAVFAIQQRG